MGLQRQVETPNISGQERLRRIVNEDSSAWGCLTTIDGPAGFTKYPWQGQDTATGAGFGIDASLSSSIYTGTKMQPSALQVLPCIRF